MLCSPTPRLRFRSADTWKLPLVLVGSIALTHGAQARKSVSAEIPRSAIASDPCANQDAPLRPRSEVDACGRWVIEHYSNRKLAEYGILDVTKAPYLADPTGTRDSTGAIQQALKDARDARLATYLPNGTYLVSNTITCIQGVVTPDRWPFGRSPVPADQVTAGEDGFNYHSDYYPCILMGSRTGRRSTIVLSPHSAGFGDPQRLKPVLYLWARLEYTGPGGAREWKNRSEWDLLSNPKKPAPWISYNQMVVDVDLVLGKGNPGAVGIDDQAAQGAAIEDVKINATGSFAGVDKAPGSGGGIHDLTVIGGRYGLYLRGSTGSGGGAQPVPVVSDLTLKDQTERSILYVGRGPMTVVGGRIEGAGVQVQGPQDQPWNGAMNFVDTEFHIHGDSCAIRGNRSIYLHNVYFEYANAIACIEGSPVLKGKFRHWTHVKAYAAAATLQYPQWLGGGLHRDALYVNGRQAQLPDRILQLDSTSPPADLQTQHALTLLPSWNDKNVVNVREAPYDARGDGKTDDTQAIQHAIDEHDAVFLPKGEYRLSRALVLKSHTQLFGIDNVLSVLLPIRSKVFSDPDQPAPLVETVNEPSADTELAFVELRVPVTDPAVYALLWRAGRRSVVRNIRAVRTAWEPDAPPAASPMIRIEGSGGGRWYDLYQDGWWDQGPDYRHLLVKGTREPLFFYMLNPEHARGDAQVEFRNARNISVYSLKSEGIYTVLWMRQCRYIRIYGYGGFSGPRPKWPLFRIDDSSDFLLANVDPDQLNNSPNARNRGWFAALTMPSDPRTWLLIIDNASKSLKHVDLRGMEQTVLYERGNPNHSTNTGRFP